ncbi:glycosyltransferase [Nocardia jiangsuensis]|uniref:Glycosyltransferase n=1 Tax=Nocardia jiangsuensis TaxID=1691563 RepID=A0ABV8DLX0_9NOCA
MTRFLVYTAPATGHTLPLVPGLLELRRRGHEVHVRTLPALVGPLRTAGLSADAVDPRVTAVEVTDFRATSDTERLRSGQVDLLRRGRFDGPDLDAAVAEHRPDVLLVDSIAYGAQTRAQASPLPTAMVLPSVLPVRGRGIPPYGLGLKPLSGPLGRARDAVGWKLVERMFGRAMLPGLNELRRAAGLPEFRSPLDQFTAQDAVIVLTGEPLEYPRTDLPPHVHLVGAQPWDLPAERPAYLDEPGDPWVLVTCSTDYQGDEDLARIAVEALRDQPVRVLLTLAEAYEGAALTSAGNIRVERFVPHGHVLPHCAAVVTHGGFGIVSKAMAAGVPAVVVPFGRDQPEIARRVSEAGAGVTLRSKELNARSLRVAVERARALTPGARAAAATLRAHGGAARFADAAEGLAPALRQENSAATR